MSTKNNPAPTGNAGTVETLGSEMCPDQELQAQAIAALCRARQRSREAPP